MESVNQSSAPAVASVLSVASVPEPEREAVLSLQELPELGGTVRPDILGLTSWISVESDCTSTTYFTTSTY